MTPAKILRFWKYAVVAPAAAATAAPAFATLPRLNLNSSVVTARRWEAYPEFSWVIHPGNSVRIGERESTALDLRDAFQIYFPNHGRSKLDNYFRQLDTERLVYSLRRGLAANGNALLALREYLDDVVMIMAEASLTLGAAEVQAKFQLSSPSFDPDGDRSRVSIAGGHNFLLFMDPALASVPYGVNLDSSIGTAEFAGGKRPARAEVLTGGNSRGKTTYAKTVGQITTAALQHLPVPADHVVVSGGLKGVRVHFSEHQDVSMTGTGEGRWKTQQAGVGALSLLAARERYRLDRATPADKAR